MVTIIFIAEDGEPMQLAFTKNEALNSTHNYGKWNINTNYIELNDKGWSSFEMHRKEVRNLKPMLELLEKTGN